MRLSEHERAALLQLEDGEDLPLMEIMRRSRSIPKGSISYVVDGLLDRGLVMSCHSPRADVSGRVRNMCTFKITDAGERALAAWLVYHGEGDDE
jgi:hypothetical protein